MQTISHKDKLSNLFCRVPVRKTKGFEEIELPLNDAHLQWVTRIYLASDQEMENSSVDSFSPGFKDKENSRNPPKIVCFVGENSIPPPFEGKTSYRWVREIGISLLDGLHHFTNSIVIFRP